MNNHAFLFVAALASMTACAQKTKEKDIPAAVTSAFQKNFPKAEELRWDKEGSNYEASFEWNEVDQSVLFDARGNTLETEMEIAQNELPKAALDYVAAHYNGKSVKEAAKITDASGKVTYEVEIKGKDLMFDNSGTYLSSSND